MEMLTVNLKVLSLAYLIGTW